MDSTIETIRRDCADCLSVCGEGDVGKIALTPASRDAWLAQETSLDCEEISTKYDLLCFECYRAVIVAVYGDRMYRLLHGKVTRTDA